MTKAEIVKTLTTAAIAAISSAIAMAFMFNSQIAELRTTANDNKDRVIRLENTLFQVRTQLSKALIEELNIDDPEIKELMKEHPRYMVNLAPDLIPDKDQKNNKKDEYEQN